MEKYYHGPPGQCGLMSTAIMHLQFLFTRDGPTKLPQMFLYPALLHDVVFVACVSTASQVHPLDLHLELPLLCGL